MAALGMRGFDELRGFASIRVAACRTGPFQQALRCFSWQPHRRCAPAHARARSARSGQNCRSDFMANCSGVPPGGAEALQLPAAQCRAALGRLPKRGASRLKPAAAAPAPQPAARRLRARLAAAPPRCRNAPACARHVAPATTETAAQPAQERPPQPPNRARSRSALPPPRAAARLAAAHAPACCGPATDMGLCADAAAAAARPARDRSRLRRRSSGGVHASCRSGGGPL